MLPPADITSEADIGLLHAAIVHEGPTHIPPQPRCAVRSAPDVMRKPLSDGVFEHESFQTSWRCSNHAGGTVGDAEALPLTPVLCAVKKLRLWEYEVIDVGATVSAFREVCAPLSPFSFSQRGGRVGESCIAFAPYQVSCRGRCEK